MTKGNESVNLALTRDRTALEASVGACEACIYYRVATPPNPVDGVQLSSPKTIELHTKWQHELANRALAEQQRFERQLPFDFEPWAYSYCSYFSEIESAATHRRVWVLCAHANPDDSCKAFAGRGK